MNSETLILDNRYILHETLGEGSMGLVWRATDRLSGETVALKQVSVYAHQETALPLTNESESTLRLALAGEFQTLASLHHPHLIGVLDYGFDQNQQPYFTMDYLPDAQTVIQAAVGQSVTEQVSFIIHILQALAYVHRQHILHRDLKPGNVLVANGRLRVLDFGLAALREEVRGSAGTLTYMAPEVLEGKMPTEAADLYAVGVIAYEMLAGDHPFETEDLDRLIDQILDEVPEVGSLPVNKALSKVVGRLLSKKPDERYESAEAAIAAFCEADGRLLPVESLALREGYLQAAKFVGRDPEMTQLLAALEKAVAGQGSAWLVAGESGVGKSRLLHELRTRALVQGAFVLSGQAISNGGLPYQLWREPLRRLLLTIEIDDLQAGILKPLIPQIERLLGRDVSEVSTLSGEAGQQRLLQTMTGLFRRVTRPLLLLLEDLQWAEESLAVLEQLQRQAAHLPLLIVASYRDDERPDLLQSLPDFPVLKLARLDESHMAELSASMLGSAGREEILLNFLQRETEGNAFFLVEVVRALAEEAGRLSLVGQNDLPKQLFPQGIQTLVRRRLERVPDWGKPLLQLAAAAGREIDGRLLASLGGNLDFEAWLTACAQAAVLEMSEGQWRFAHDKLREGLLQMLTGDLAADLHRQVALGLEAIYPDDPGQAWRLAHHWREAGEPERERQYAWQAGEQASAQFANTEAIHFLSRALELTPDAERAARYALLLAREQVYDLLGERAKQMPDLAMLGDLATELGNSQRQAEVALRQANYAEVTGEFGAAVAAAQQAVALAHEAGEQALEATAYWAWGRSLSYQGEHKTAQTQLEQATNLARLAGLIDLEAGSLRSLGSVHFKLGDVKATIDYNKAALSIYRKTANRRGETPVLMNLGTCYLEQSDFGESQEYLDQALDNCLEMGDQYIESMVHHNLGALFTAIGDYSRAGVCCQQAADLGHKVGNKQLEAFARSAMGRVAFSVGDLTAAQTHYDQALAIVREINSPSIESYLLSHRGRLEYEQGSYNEAVAYGRQAERLAQEIGEPVNQTYALLLLGDVFTDLDQLAEAHEAYQQALTLLHPLEERELQVHCLAGLAQVNLNQADKTQALDYVNQALPELEKNETAVTRGYFYAYLVCYRVLQINDDPRAAAILIRAYNLLQETAAKIEEDSWRLSFLENIAVHREIVTIQSQLPLINNGETQMKLDKEALLSHIIRVSRRMAEIRTLEPLLVYVVDEALQLVGGERGYIVLLGPDKTLEFKSMRDHEGRDLTGGDDQISHSILDEVMAGGKPIIVRNAVAEPRFRQAASVLHLQLRSVMCVPFIAHNRVIGGLYVENRSVRGRFSEEDLSPLEIFANQAATAIENAALNDKLQAAHEHLHKLDEMKSQFILLVSHELRTPLTVVQTYAGLAKRAADNTGVENFTGKLEQSIERMRTTIEEIINVFRITSGKLQLRLGMGRVDELIRSVTSEWEPVCAERQLQVDADMPNDLPVVRVDTEQFRTVLYNVIGNAIKYTPDGGTIDINGHLEENKVVITVRDSGIGVPLEEQERIFDIFYVLGEMQHHSTSKHAFRGGGLGLGLPIARGIVQAHGGTIQLHSPGYDPERLPGTSCVITLPLPPKELTNSWY